MATVAPPTMPRAPCRPTTHTENPHSLLTTSVVTVDTCFGTWTAATVELWQSTTNNALAKVIWDTLQTLKGCHPPPLSLSLGLVLRWVNCGAIGTQDLGLKGWNTNDQLTTQWPLQIWDNLKVLSIPALLFRVPSELAFLEELLVLEGLPVDAEAGKGQVEYHCVLVQMLCTCHLGLFWTTIYHLRRIHLQHMRVLQPYQHPTHCIYQSHQPCKRSNL